MRPLSDILQKLPTTPDAGLSPDSVLASRKQFGENWLTPLPREPLWKKFLEKFDEPIIKILLAAALLSMVVDLFKDQAYKVGGFSVGLLILGVIAAYAARSERTGFPRSCLSWRCSPSSWACSPDTSSSRAWR